MKKKTYTPEYKAKIVVEMLRDETHTSEIAAREEISRTQLQNWKREFLDNAALVFSQNKVEKQAKAEVKAAEERGDESMKKVGCLSIENDFLKKKYREIHGHDYEGRK
jgi:transposase-like protein